MRARANWSSGTRSLLRHLLRWARCAAVLGIASAPALAACSLNSGPERTVTRVIDGEMLQLDDGTRIVLANVMAPRAADVGLAAGQREVEQRGIAALDALVTGKTVRIAFDQVRTDRYGMARGILRLGRSADAPSVQQMLARDGHVRAVARHGERACIDEIIAAEDDARAAARGLWVDGSNRIRPAVPARDLATFRGTFQIVTGDVHSVEDSRDVSRLLLGPNRQRDVSITLRGADRALLGPLGGDLRALVGRRIEARGWIDRRPGRFSGPDIDVSLIGHVRLLP